MVQSTDKTPPSYPGVEYLPPPPVPTIASQGIFFDSKQRLGAEDSWAVVAGDVDGDGDVDVVVANYSEVTENQPNQVWLNDGHGTFQLGQQFHAGTACRALALGDLDQDGDFDLLVRDALVALFLDVEVDHAATGLADPAHEELSARVGGVN